MNIVNKKIEDIIPYIRNPRKNQAIDKVAGSLKEFGFRQPIVVDKQMVIIAGHTRFEAAKKLGIKEVPIHIADNLTPAQVKAYRIADNRVAQDSEWDIGMLNTEFTDLLDMHFDLDILGFNAKELEDLIVDKENIGLTDEDEIPETPKEPKAQLGDIYKLDEHKLMCGDSSKIDDVNKLMPETANMLFTDPPYLMDFDGGIHADGSKSYNAKHGAIKNDKMSLEQGNDFLDAVNSIIKTKVDGAFYISFYRLGIDRFFNSLNRTGLKCRSLIVWDKGNHTLSNSDYMSMYEPIFYGWVNNHKFYGGNNGMDIWKIKRTSKNVLHPTMKPVELVEKAILDGSAINGIVLDLFAGSGTTIIACEKHKRKARLMELDPKYVDVIIERWENYTGKKAELVKD